MEDTLGIDIGIPQKLKSGKIPIMLFNASFFLFSIFNWIACVKLTQNTMLLLSSLMLYKGGQAFFDKDIASELIIYQKCLGLYIYFKDKVPTFSFLIEKRILSLLLHQVY